jgi:uncharacterized protein YndB with AHSA1/START domain
MPAFSETAISRAPPEEVWKLLYDPARFPEWWVGVASVDAQEPAGTPTSRFSYVPEGQPDVSLLQLLETSGDDRRIVVSCLVFDYRFEWRLEPMGDGRATSIGVLVDVPEAQAPRFDMVREAIGRSVAALAALAARA